MILQVCLMSQISQSYGKEKLPGGPDLIRGALKRDRVLFSKGDSKCGGDSLLWAWKMQEAYGKTGGQPVGAEGSPWLTANKETGTSELQMQGTKSCQ